MVTVFSKPGCVQCTATEKQLLKRGVEFFVVDLSQDAAALDRWTAQGVAAAPIVELDNGVHWTGFRPDRIDGIAKSAA